MITSQIVNGPNPTRDRYAVKVENVVASGKLQQNLDLNQISGTIPGARYNPQRFPGLFYNLKKPKSMLLMFNSGKIISMGTKSIRQAKKAILNGVKELQSAGTVILNEPKIEIQNMVACADLRTRIDLEDIAIKLTRTIYEPENFPGLIYMMDEPKVTLLLFTTGKVVCAGAKSEAAIYSAIVKIRQTLETNGFAKTQEYENSNSQATPKIDPSMPPSQESEKLTCLATVPT